MTTAIDRESQTAAPPTRQPLTPIAASPSWARAMPTGPDARVKITEEYAKLVGKDAYFWAWPLVNTCNRRLHFTPIKEMSYIGPLMEPSLNRLIMLTDYVESAERAVACPNQDVVYGLGALGLDVSPVVSRGGRAAGAPASMSGDAP